MAKSPEHIALGRAIRAIRKKAGLSQFDAAQKSGINRTYLGQIENGNRNPTYATLIWIARTIDVSVSELVRTAEEMARVPNDVTNEPGSPRS